MIETAIVLILMIGLLVLFGLATNKIIKNKEKQEKEWAEALLKERNKGRRDSDKEDW